MAKHTLKILRCKHRNGCPSSSKEINRLIRKEVSALLFDVFQAIYKTKNTGMGNGMRGMQGTMRMFTEILGNLLEDSGECSHFSVPGNSRKDSGECLRRFRGMFKKIPGNVPGDFGECY